MQQFSINFNSQQWMQFIFSVVIFVNISGTSENSALRPTPIKIVFFS